MFALITDIRTALECCNYTVIRYAMSIGTLIILSLLQGPHTHHML